MASRGANIAVDTDATEVEASVAVPRYFAAYEKAFDLPVYRPVKVTVVCDRGERLRIETDRAALLARGVINATGTWETPYIPEYPGAERFHGRQLHTRDYRVAEEFAARQDPRFTAVINLDGGPDPGDPRLVAADEAHGAEHPAVRQARDHEGPVVIVVPAIPHADLPGAGVWWDVAPAEVAEQEAVARLRAEYEDGLATQRWHG